MGLAYRRGPVENNRKRINGQIVELERGQLSHSIRFLSIRWDWSISRVNRFLKRLKTETMIETENETGQNVITICNYETYQDFNKYRETVSETVFETRPEHDRHKEEHQITPDNKIYIKDDYFFVGKVGKISQQQADAWKERSRISIFERSLKKLTHIIPLIRS